MDNPQQETKMKKFKFTIHGNIYDVEINNFEGNIAEIEVNGTLYRVEVNKEVKQSKTPTLVRSAVPEQKKEIKKTDRGSTIAVKAPLPGNILEVFVKIGDIVKKDQKLLVMEAMKMENVVLAEKDGVIELVKAQQGMSVLQGDTLIEMV